MEVLVKCARVLAFTGSRSLTLSRLEAPLLYNACRSFGTSYKCLSERKFTEQHEWVKMEGKVGTVGVSQHAQQALGDIVFVELPEKGRTYDKDEECGAVESVKAASEIFCPVSGTVVDTNSALDDKPGLINSSCYDEGWIFKVELSNESDLDGMMSEEKYQEFLKAQEE